MSFNHIIRGINRHARTADMIDSMKKAQSELVPAPCSARFIIRGRPAKVLPVEFWGHTNKDRARFAGYVDWVQFDQCDLQTESEMRKLELQEKWPLLEFEIIEAQNDEASHA